MLKSMTFRSTLAAVACAISLSAHAMADAPKPLDIPAGNLVSALEALEKQAAIELVFRPEQLKSFHTGGVKGTYQPDAAIRLLIKGTPLELRTDPTGAMVIAPPRAPGDIAAGNSQRTREGDEGKEGTQSKSFWDRFRLAQVDQGKPSALASSSPSTGEAGGGQGSQDSSSNRSTLDEVLVTAQKRTERLRDVPVSISVVTANDIDRRGLFNGEDYLRGIPGASELDSTRGGMIVIRGMETAPNNQNFFAGSTTATYFGETPTTGSGGVSGNMNVDLKLVDVERVEVLRGPQGTAFGSASIGGAVRTIPVAPKLDDVEAKIVGVYSNTSGTGGDNYTVQAVGNLPLIHDKLAIRVTGYTAQNSGFYRNVAGSTPALLKAATTYGAQAFVTNQDEVGSSYVLGGRVAALFQATDDLKFTLSYLSQKTEIDGFAASTSGGYDQAVLQVAPEHVVRGQKGGVSDMDIDIANATMDYNLGWADLFATYSYLKSGSVFSFPNFTANYWPVSQWSDNDHRQHTGEVRLSTKFDGPWNFLAGVYAEQLKDEVLYTNFWFGDPSKDFFAPGKRDLGVRPDHRNLRQKAAFGEVSWKLWQDLTLTGGARAYKYDRDIRVDATGVFYSGGLHVGDDAEASGATYRANLSYKPSDDALLYASFSQGFRPGQLSSGVPPGVCDLNGDGIIDGASATVASTRRLNPDTVNNYELGSKLSLLDRRLTLETDVFRMEWSGVPISVKAAPSGPCGNFFYLINATKAQSDGAELQANFQIAKPLRLDVGGSWVHARLTEAVTNLTVPIAAGTRLPGSPEVNANLGLQYGFSIGGHEAFLRADSTYVGTFKSALTDTRPFSGGYVKIDVSARVTIQNLSIDLFARNLTNADEFTFGGDSTGLTGYRLQPRTIGLQLGYTFEDRRDR
jgi:iron complex outermembrane receptor protein